MDYFIQIINGNWSSVPLMILVGFILLEFDCLF